MSALAGCPVLLDGPLAHLDRLLALVYDADRGDRPMALRRTDGQGTTPCNAEGFDLISTSLPDEVVKAIRRDAEAGSARPSGGPAAGAGSSAGPPAAGPLLREDFLRLMADLRLERYLAARDQELVLDLRESLFSLPEAAFQGLHRSTFLHRLRALGLPFASPVPAAMAAGTWREAWSLRWGDECERRLADVGRAGATVEDAAASVLAERLAGCRQAEEVMAVAREAVACDVPACLGAARGRLRELAPVQSGLQVLAQATAEVAELIRYGSVRRFDAEPLGPLLSELFLQAALALPHACLSTRPSADAVASAILQLADVAGGLLSDTEEARLWDRMLGEVAGQDVYSPFLSGVAWGLVSSRILGTPEQASATLRDRLLPRAGLDAAAHWFEGVWQAHRPFLLHRVAFWWFLDDFVSGLNEAGFWHVLIPLRRTFGRFAESEVRQAASLLAEITGKSLEELRRAADSSLTEEEARRLTESLGDLDLGL
jgi:hypothetical protein